MIVTLNAHVDVRYLAKIKLVLNCYKIQYRCNNLQKKTVEPLLKLNKQIGLSKTYPPNNM